MKKIFIAFFLVFMTCYSSAQTVTYESVRLADIILDNTWQTTVEQYMPGFLAGLEAKFRAKGIPDSLTKIYIAELSKAMNRENIAKALSQSITNNLTIQEVNDLTIFMQSDLGKKYLNMNREFESNPAYYLPIFKQACNATVPQLNEADRRKMEATNLCITN